MQLCVLTTVNHLSVMLLLCRVYLVCGLLVTCACVFLAYRYLLSSSGEAELEHREQKVTRKEESKQRPAGKMSDSEDIPASVLKRAPDVSVLDKMITFTVDDQVSVVSCQCHLLSSRKLLTNSHFISV